MKYEREIVKPIAEGVRLRFRYERGLEPLEVQSEEWITVRSWDNSHERHQHHLHRYSRASGRADQELLARPSIQLAMAHAIADAVEGWEAILQAWER